MRKALGYALVLALFGLLFGAGFYWRDIGQGQLPSARAVTTFLGLDSGGHALSVGQQFQQIFNKVARDYYRPTTSKSVKYAAISGMMGALGDPHTAFLEPQIARAFDSETQAKFFGIGARLMPDPLGVRISSVFVAGPADKAGMKAGDIVTAVDGVVVAGKDPDAIANMIRGQENTPVLMQVLRKNAPAPITLRAIRRQIIAPTAEGNVIEGTRTGYLAISQFAAPTADQFVKEIVKLERQEIDGLIIDLRGNPGGLLSTATDMLSLFVEDKVVVTMKERKNTAVERTNSGQVRKWSYPIVCLVNGDSASASEIFAGCLRDYGMATIVGEHSYGKASVQNVFPLKDDASVKVTIAKYFLPTTPDISRKVDDDGQYVSGGLLPDYEAKFDPDMDAIFGDPKTDPQLLKAIEVLKMKR